MGRTLFSHSTKSKEEEEIQEGEMMKVLAINGTYRPEGTTARLTEKALAGAASEGAETEHILLANKDIQYCTNCLACYRDKASTIAPCPIQDDVRGILESIRESDGLLLTSPVHGGLCTALMMAFLERACFTLAKPTGESMGMKGCPEPRLTDKARALATLVSAGAVTPELRQYCDMVTPILSEYGALLVNGMPMANMYAAAFFPREMEDSDWQEAFLIRELTEDQLREAYELGADMARAIKDGHVQPIDMAAFDSER